MSVEKVAQYLKKFDAQDRIIQFEESSATVELAAARLEVEPKRIAKTMSFLIGDEVILIVTAGDARVANPRYKEIFGAKANMIKGDQVKELTGYDIGGVCPFGNPDGVKKYLDISLKRFDTVFPAAGSAKSAVKLTPTELYEYSKALGWVDLCKDWQ